MRPITFTDRLNCWSWRNKLRVWYSIPRIETTTTRSVDFHQVEVSSDLSDFATFEKQLNQNICKYIRVICETEW